jgi:hypothetical protein
MRTTAVLSILIITAACTVNAQRNVLQGASTGRADYQNVSYRTIAASDGTYTVQLPMDWQLRDPQLKSRTAQNGRGESVA